MRQHVLLALLVSAAPAISGCATAYQSTGLSGGFKDTQLAPDVFRVSFAGNVYTSPERVQDFALLRASELCLANGLKHFVVVQSADQSQTATYTTPPSSYTSGSVNAYGNSAAFSSTTTYNPAQSVQIYTPGVGIMVRGFPSKPEGIFSFDASFLVRTLKAKYKIE